MTTSKNFLLGLAAIFIMSGFFVVQNALASVSGPNNVGTGANVSGVGTVNWSNPGRITANDGLNATATINIVTNTTKYLQGTNYGFAIPTDATINGIEVSIERKSSASTLGLSVNDNVVKLIKAGTIVGDNKKLTADWLTAMTVANYGGGADLWGTTWTPSEINASDFGVALSVNTDAILNRTASVNYIQVTITYTPATKLTVNKVIVPVTDTGLFNLQIDGSTAGTGANVGNGGTTGAVILTVGSHTVSETAGTATNLSDYISVISGDCATDGSITLATGDAKVCTITNTKKGSITVVKDVVSPSDAVVLDNQSFNAHLDSGSADSFSENFAVTYSGLIPGQSYTITEDANANYDFVSFSQDSDTETSGAQITVLAGQTITLTITNRQKRATLTVIKTVTNHGIGTEVSGSFTMQIGGTNVSSTGFPGEDSPGTVINLDPGTFSVSETGSEAYAMSLSSGCLAEVIGSNESLTCTVTNSDISPIEDGALTLIKTVVNDNGGSLDSGDFTLHITNVTDSENPVEVSGVTNGVANFLAPGNYVISETSPTSQGYTQTSITCVSGINNTSGNITLTAQTAWVCTITNDDNAPSLTLVKSVTNNNGGTAVATDWTLTATGLSTISGAGGIISGNTFKAGIYTLSETSTDTENEEATEGYTAGIWSCTNGVSVSETNQITLAINQTTVCTIINDDEPATLTILKNTNQEGNDTFQFSITDHASILINTAVSNSSGAISLNKGTYQVNEVNLASPWHLASVSCVYEGESVGTSVPSVETIAGGEEITVGSGDEVTCTFTNTKKGTLIVKKVIINDNGGLKTADDFSFEIRQGEETAVSAIAFEADGQNNVIKNAGTYNITEVTDAEYTTTYENCSAVVLVAGGEQTCTITNNDIAPVVTPAPVPSGGGGGGGGTGTFILPTTPPPTPTPTPTPVPTSAATPVPNPALATPTAPSDAGQVAGASTGPGVGTFQTDEPALADTTKLPEVLGEENTSLQPAAVSEAVGFSTFLNWIIQHWPWLLILIIVLMLLYWWWRGNQTSAPTN